MTISTSGQRFSLATRGFISAVSILDCVRGKFNGCAELALGADGARHALLLQDSEDGGKYHAGDGIAVTINGNKAPQEGIIHEGQRLETSVDDVPTVSAEYHRRGHRK